MVSLSFCSLVYNAFFLIAMAKSVDPEKRIWPIVGAVGTAIGGGIASEIAYGLGFDGFNALVG